MTLKLDDPNDQSGLSAQRMIVLRRQDAQMRSGHYADVTPTRDSRLVKGPFRPVDGPDGLGVEAYTEEYRIVQGPPLPTDTQVVELTAAYRDLMVMVAYRGEDVAAGKPGEQNVIPLPAETARAGALAVAREVIASLNACRTCRR
ncbi:hypothetical protein [Actinomadura gamaensis]|uniref:Uncharacterized protein n=1 Tax=Actinomadura gamaensis TaxID=1763541 RepID=A0ABV9U3B3_9ACTN